MNEILQFRIKDVSDTVILQNQHRSPAIDTLRGLFTLYVLFVSHLVPWTLYSQGAEAVPYWLVTFSEFTNQLFQKHGELNPAVLGFIVLSGFCIHRSGIRNAQSLWPFAIRRAFRILPVFWVACIVSVGIFMLSAEANKATYALTATHELSAVCLVAKMSAIASILPVTHPCSFQGNAPLLTVMVEIGLYAFYGVSFVWGGMRVVKLACAISVLVGMTVAGLSSQNPIFYNWWQNSSLMAFLPYWWIGAIATGPSGRFFLRTAPSFVALWLILSIFSIYFDNTAITAEIRKLVGASLVAGLLVKLEYAKMPKNIFSIIGTCGYSVYAFHAPLAVWMCVAGVAWWKVGTFAIIVGMSVYALFERPLNRAGHILSRQAKRSRAI